MYGYQCQYCEGTVRPKLVEQEAFKHKNGFVILEQVTVGVCDECGNRYYDAAILLMVHKLAAGRMAPQRTAMIPVAQAA